MIIDTHSHIHMSEFRDDLPDVLDRAHAAGVEKLLCVGVNDLDSAEAIAVAKAHANMWSTVGLHPHDADRGYEALEVIEHLSGFESVVAIGECGLDYFRSETSPEEQERALRFQIELAIDRDLPLVFHVRDAFEAFWTILDDYADNVRGTIHCFTAGLPELHAAIKRGLYISLNGIMTFTSDQHQLDAAKAVPLERLILETDCPFLTPVPLRGKRNEPANIALTAKFLADLRGEPLEDLESATTANGEELFRI